MTEFLGRPFDFLFAIPFVLLCAVIALRTYLRPSYKTLSDADRKQYEENRKGLFK